MTGVLEKTETDAEEEIMEGPRRLFELPQEKVEGELFRGAVRIRGDYHDKIREVFRNALEGSRAFRATQMEGGDYMIKYYSLPESTIQKLKTKRRKGRGGIVGDRELKTASRGMLTISQFEQKFGIRRGKSREPHYDGV